MTYSITGKKISIDPSVDLILVSFFPGRGKEIYELVRVGGVKIYLSTESSQISGVNISYRTGFFL